MDKIKTDKNSLRKFGITMGIAFLVITLLILIRQKHSILITSIISASFFLVSFTFPKLLKPIYIFWMELAFVLGWINTRLILIIIFYLVFVPVSLIIKVIRVDLLDRKIEKNRVSYWKIREIVKTDPTNYERQF